MQLQFSLILDRPVGSFEILGVLMTFVACYTCNLEMLGVLNGAIAPPLPTALVEVLSFKSHIHNYNELFPHFNILIPLFAYGLPTTIQ